MQSLVEHDGVEGIAHEFGIGFDAIRHVGMAEDAPVQVFLESAWVKPGAGFHQFEQVDDLMVAPVTDVRPGVIGFWHFPVDPVVGDAIRVVPISGCGVQKHSDHVLNILRI